MPSEDAHFSEDQKRLLEHEAFVAKVLEYRAGKGERQRFLDRPGAVAILAGVIGALASFLPQWWTTERQYRESRVLHIQTKRAESIVNAFRAVGNLQVAANNLVVLSQGVLTARPKEEEEYRHKANAADEEWRRERDGIGVLLALYYGHASAVETAWSKVRAAVEGYSTCAQDWWENPDKKSSGEACANQHARLSATQNELRRAVATTP